MKTLFLLTLIGSFPVMLSSCNIPNPERDTPSIRAIWLRGARLYTWKDEKGVWKFSLIGGSVSTCPTFDQISRDALTGLDKLKWAFTRLPKETKITWLDLDSTAKELELPKEAIVREMREICRKHGLWLTVWSDSKDRSDVGEWEGDFDEIPTDDSIEPE